jgi:Kef-type K+ transport system membrane component KefB
VGYSLINDIAICIVAAFALAVVSQWFKQPLIIAYLVAGLIVGPVGFGWIQDDHSIETIGELGLMFLLFMIGLEIDLKKVLQSGKLILVTAIVQIAGCFFLGVGVFKLAGFSMGGGHLDAIYLGFALTFSSTVIIVKILYDKREIDTLPGRITLGVLVLQDVAAILVLAIQKDLADPEFAAMGRSFLNVMVLLAVSFAASRFLLPALFRSVARLPELVLVGALAWCFLVAGLAAALGLSREMGALVAGVAISTFPYTMDVAARVNTLRDFFVTLFFVSLGMQIPAPTGDMLMWACVLSALVVVSRSITVFPVLYKMKMGHRSSLLPMLNLSQVSEFSLVMVSLGMGMGHVSERTVGIILYAFVITAVLSSYAITQSGVLLEMGSRLLKAMGLKDLDQVLEKEGGGSGLGDAPAEIYMLGFSWTASSLLDEVTRNHSELLPRLAVIDFNPVVIRELEKRNVRVLYGDITKRDTLRHAKVGEAKVIVCTLPNTLLKGATNLRLLKELRAINPHARIIVHAELISDIATLYEAGADYVSAPRLIEAERLSDVICAACENRLAERRAELDERVAGRDEVIP